MKLFNVCAIFLSILGCFSLSGMELDAPFSKSSLFSSSVSRGPEITPPLIHPQETQYQPNDEIIKHIVNKDMDYFAHNKDAMITSLNYFLHNARRDEDNEKKAITILNILQNQSQCEKTVKIL